MKKWKKRVLYTSIILTLIITHVKDYQYHEDYEILENDEAYGRYRNGKIYIGKESFLKNLDNIEEDDVLIEDERNIRDSNLKVYESYKINDKEARNDILEVMLAYETENPSRWDRSIESMRLEWYMHNLLHKINYKLDRTTDVDLNNEDEETYDNKIMKKILRL